MTDEQKCLEWLKHRRDNMPMAGAKRMFGIAISALEKQEKDRWIPVKENPKEPERIFDRYLVYTKFERFGIADYFGGGGWSGYDVDGDQLDELEIVAWRPLPEPYQEDEA